MVIASERETGGEKRTREEIKALANAMEAFL